MKSTPKNNENIKSLNNKKIDKIEFHIKEENLDMKESIFNKKKMELKIQNNNDISKNYNEKSEFLNSLNKNESFNVPSTTMNKLRYQLRKLKKCSTKYSFKNLLIETSLLFKKILIFYMQECFFFDLYSRRLLCKNYLMSRRNLLYRIIENPSALDSDCHFNNNILKNFCKGMANFIIRNLKHILKLFKLRDNNFMNEPL